MLIYYRNFGGLPIAGGFSNFTIYCNQTDLYLREIYRGDFWLYIVGLFIFFDNCF
jgi:hypothetical protein